VCVVNNPADLKCSEESVGETIEGVCVCVCAHGCVHVCVICVHVCVIWSLMEHTQRVGGVCALSLSLCWRGVCSLLLEGCVLSLYLFVGGVCALSLSFSLALSLSHLYRTHSCTHTHTWR